MKLLKKLSAILLAIMLLFGSMPMTDLGLENLFSSIAFAVEEDYEEEEEYIETKKDFVSGDYIYRYTKNKEIRIIKYMGSDKNVTVPETIDGMPVIRIDLAAFCPDFSYENYTSYKQYNNPECENIESVTLPDSITQIHHYAFRNCKSLQSIDMPENLVSIGRQAFYECKNLRNIDMPENLSSIGEQAFMNCSSLESLEFSNLSSIGIKAFMGCSSLENLEFSDQLTSIGGNAFSGTKIKNLNIASGEKNFSAYSSMLVGSVVENINIEAKSITINSNALNSETLKNIELKATEKLTIEPSGIVSNALENLTVEGKAIIIKNSGIKSNSLKTLTLDATVSIGENGIVSDSLETLTLSGDVETIAAKAILCPSLKKVTINGDLVGCATSAFGYRGDDTLPDTVVVNNCFSADVYDMFEEFLDYVGEVTFTDTVKQIVFKKYVEPTEIFTEDAYQYYINEKGEAVIYKYTGKHKGTVHLFVPETLGGAPVTVIGRRAFEDLESDFEFIYLPDTVTRIENNAFAGSKKISTIRISPNLESIGHRAFCGAEGLWAVGPYNSFDDTEGGDLILSDAITYIPTEAFKDCPYITQIQANGVTAVLDGAFRQSRGNNRYFSETFSEDFYWVGDGAFYGSYIKQFKHDKNVTHLGKEAFYNSLLTEFNFNETLTEIPDGAFYSTNITEIVIPSGVETIGELAFADCTLLKSVKMSDSVTSIGKSAFKNCAVLESINLSDSVTKIGESAFSYCKSFKTLSLPKALTVIEKSTFENCESLESIEIPDSVTTIKEKAFYGCKALLSVEIPDSVTTIERQVFENCSALKSVKLSNSLTEILESTFSGCSALENLEFPDSVTAIYADAFKNCSSLKGEFTLPKNIRAIRMGAFAGTGYSVLNYDLPESDYTIQSTSYIGMDNLTTIKIGDNVTAIPAKAFENLKTIKEVIMSDSVKTIGSSAFEDCSGLESIKMSENITDIGSSAFRGCSKLTEITLPECLRSIGSSAFRGCSKLTEITLPECLRSIDAYAFYGCSKLTEMTLPKDLTYLGGEALPKEVTTLYYNSENLTFSIYNDRSPLCHLSLTNIIFSDTIKRIPDGMFSGMKTLESLTLPDSITEIGEKAFYKSSFKSIKLPSKLIVIEDYAFSYADVRFEGDALPNGTRMIGDYAFDHCTGFEEIYIPDSVVDIAEYAFYGCVDLIKVRMSSNVKLIASSAFAYCPILKEFIWDADVKLIADYAFYNCKALKDFNFAGVELVYPNSFTNSGVTLVTLGHDKNDEATDLIMVETQSFMGCENLDTVAIGGNVTTIKSEAFASCSSLETAVISDSVINIATNAFDNCDSLTIYCEEDSYAHKYAVKNNIPVSTFVVAPIPNQTYTGSEIEPEIDVSVSGEKVMENTDFTVKYSDNINVGTAKATVIGKGIYKVLSSIANFTIITKSIAPVTFAAISEQDYTGEAVIPTLTVTDGNRVLKEGVDYTVTFKNNVDEGTATATIQGIGNYHGTASTSFEIRELSTSQSIGNTIIDFFTSLWLRIVSFFTSIFR